MRTTKSNQNTHCQVSDTLLSRWKQVTNITQQEVWVPWPRRRCM